MKQMVKAGLAALALTTAACSDDSGGMGPDPISMANVAVEECQVITFNTTGGAADHMDTWGGTTVFGFNVTASGSRYVNPAGSFGGARAPVLFYSPITDQVEDNDLQYPNGSNEGGSDEWNTGPACQDCEDLNLQSFLVIQDERTEGGNPFYGDYRWGGTIQLDFAGLPSGTYYVKSWQAVDDDGGEPSIDLYADGTTFIAQSTGAGDAQVETVAGNPAVKFNTSLQFRFGTEAQDNVTGSGGIDNIEICRLVDEPPSGEGTRTPGYWKNDKKDWPVDQVTIGGIVYTRAQADDLMEHPTAKDKTYNMFEQLVATTLNLANGTEDSCIQDVVDEANAWMAAHPVGSGVEAKSNAWQVAEGGNTMSAATIHSTLDQYNNGLLCAPHAD